MRPLAGCARLALASALWLAASCAVDDSPMLEEAGTVADELGTVGDGAAAGEELAPSSVCTQGTYRCHAYLRTLPGGQGASAQAAAPFGYGPAELQSAYNIDSDSIVGARPTVAIVLAYGYAAIESDLAAYRTYYGLPPCTIASGCLRVVNQDGEAAPLPPNPPASDDWTVETALDMDMVSAACPRCKLLVVQANDNVGEGLLIAQRAAAALGATVISNSWGGPEQPSTPPATIAASEAYFDQPNVAIFVASGDAGYNDGGEGPDYPATSAHTIAVGGTRLVRAPGPRGWSETAWASGGSACSLSIAKPSYQTESPCAFKATSDVAAVGDPATGLAVYNAGRGGWITVGGTSASAPLVAAMVAATGNGSQTSGGFYAANRRALYDVVSGSNGACGDGTLLCNAAVGWDGPTGYGTPNAAALAGGDPDVKVGRDAADGGGCSAAGNAGAGAMLAISLLALRRRRPQARSGAADGW